MLFNGGLEERGKRRSFGGLMLLLLSGDDRWRQRGAGWSVLGERGNNNSYIGVRIERQIDLCRFFFSVIFLFYTFFSFFFMVFCFFFQNIFFFLILSLFIFFLFSPIFFPLKFFSYLKIFLIFLIPYSF